ncbi:MAG: zf-HC2 domain-containing protein [Phycisphaerales bacterium]|nr:zf-HC2 domain-containing protein [Phycisphaerales bacterium]
MRHVRQTDLIKMVANELADSRRALVERHLAECPTCQGRYEQQERLWRALGQWTPDFAGRDLLPGIERKLDAAPTILRPLWSTLARICRVAAAIVIGVGAGYGAAWSSSPDQPVPSGVASAEVEESAVGALRLHYFEDVSPAGLYVALEAIAYDAGAAEGQP